MLFDPGTQCYHSAMYPTQVPSHDLHPGVSVCELPRLPLARLPDSSGTRLGRAYHRILLATTHPATTPAVVTAHPRAPALAQRLVYSRFHCFQHHSFLHSLVTLAHNDQDHVQDGAEQGTHSPLRAHNSPMQLFTVDAEASETVCLRADLPTTAAAATRVHS